MTSRKKYWKLSASFLFVLSFVAINGAVFAAESPPEVQGGMRFVQIEAKSKEDRSAIANFGISIEAVRSDSVWGFGNQSEIQAVIHSGYKILGNFDYRVGRGGHESLFGFPARDARFHTYEELQKALEEIHAKNPDITALQSIGKTTENREIFALHLNTSSEALKTGQSNKPGIIFMGNHHAREHVSLEVPYMLAEYFVKNRGDSKISNLLDSRDIWIIPMVNPDGAEYDIATGNYRWWRKNKRNNRDGSIGVDLNRNYGYQWGTGGSSSAPSSDVYMGPEPFSEPETRAIRDFVTSHLNAKVLLSFHTFSELILYPWGHSYSPVSDSKDREVFEKLARKMAAWNHYTPQRSSELYIASGDTTDWAYGEHKIFAFTFELSPNSMFGGGFYPGAKILDKVFQDNLQPCLYLTEIAGDPYNVLEDRPSPWLKHYVEPRDPESLQWMGPSL